MGGCCCCESRRAETNRTPVYFYCPQELEENELLPSPHLTPTAVPAGLLVDTNLERSIPDTYHAPPAPLPYDVSLASPRAVAGSNETCSEKTDHVHSTNSLPVGETISTGMLENSDAYEDLKGLGCNNKSDCLQDSPKMKEDELSKLDDVIASAIDEEDVCPTCLEEYDIENPRIISKCEHHFHLSCILEWMERSNTCPICDQIMKIDHTSDE